MLCGQYDAGRADNDGRQLLTKTVAQSNASRKQASRRGKARAGNASGEEKAHHQAGPKSMTSRRPITPDEIKLLREKTQLSQEKLARLLGTSWVTISRWERKLVTPNGEPQGRLGRLLELVARIGNALPANKIYDFLETPQAEFRGHRPVELLSSDYAFQDLLSFIESAKSGDMA